MFKVTNRNSKTRCEICSKLTIKTPQRRQLDFSLTNEMIMRLHIIKIIWIKAISSKKQLIFNGASN